MKKLAMRVLEPALGLTALLIFAAIFCGYSGAAQAAGDSPVGLWRIIDDQTGQAQGIMKIYEMPNGTVAGRLERTFDPSDKDKVCTECEDDRQGKPLLGLEIMRGLRRNGNGEYTGGTILDPESGSVYGCTLKVVDGGQKLQVRGYMGISLLGRTQTWVREK